MTRNVGDGRKYDYDEIFQFIVSYKEEHDGNSPTFRCIEKEFSMSRSSLTRYILNRLEKDGKILLYKDGAKTKIKVVGGHWYYDRGTVAEIGPEGIREIESIPDFSCK